MTTGSYSLDDATLPARNGSRLFWTDSRGGPRRTLWTAEPDGSGARLLLGGPDSVTSFRAFDGGRRVVVATDCGGDEHHQIRVIDVEGEIPTRHITSDFFVQHNLGSVAADGKRLAYAANAAQRERFDIIVADLTTGKRRSYIVSAVPGEWRVEAWSRDGAEIYVSQQRAGGDVGLYALDTHTGALRSLCPLAPARFLELRPVEGGILLRTDWGNDNLYVALLGADGSLTCKARVPGRDIDGYLALDGGRRFAISVNAELGHELRFGSMSEGWVVADLPLTVRGGLSFNGPERIMWSEQAADMPAQIVDCALGGTDLRVLVQPTPKRLQGIAKVETLRATAADGREVPALIYRPHTPNGACVFTIHGGPESQSLPTCQSYISQMCSRGWTVIAPNVRGSTGFGRNWLLLDNITLRRDVIGDITALQDAAIAQEGLDPKRMAVMGVSYGGYMTALQIGFETKRWQVAAVIFGFADVPSIVDAFGSWRRDHRMWEYGDPADPQVLAFQQSMSPLKQLSAVDYPVFLYHARRDLRVPIEQTDMMEVELRKGGAPVTRIGADDEGHSYTNPLNCNALWGGIVEHFAPILDV